MERVFTFAAMATQMRPEQDARLFGAATSEQALSELKQMDLEILEDGQIGGLNGVLLGAAADAGLHGGCLLGEMPHVFTQLPFPKASWAILKAFSEMAGIAVDLTELAEQSQAVEQQLGELLARVEETYGQETYSPETGEQEELYGVEPVEDETLTSAERQRIEQLFEQSAKDRSKAFELKQELDRHGVFKQYEDRFLDLFKKPN